jgi:hypothetical protein
VLLLALLIARLPSYQAHCEAVLLGDLEAAHKVWDDATKSALGK